ncbi:PKD domain-containing protein [Chitinophaga dinghuensis]|uniref:PKD domain-containing protein n=1 Tax=Chitinophaga dinghuensis TaxID=1539050 RepID=A0A327WBX4_9BACT|nr:PKD domain-containing protein [Chitinophaga dinghuensis]RAJ88093.1 PKD domain-containing protein [Chitinophaga dinghuensis]
MESTTKNKSLKTGNSSRIYIYILVAVLVLAVVFFLIKILFSHREINAHLLKDEIFLNENLVYTDNTPGAKQWQWEFGDGSKTKEQSGFYKFRTAGTYLVRLTVDGKMQQQFAVVVKDTVPVVVIDSIHITGPTAGTVGEQLRLEAEGDANIFEWSFGETGRVDAKGRTAFYTYRSPGRYNVMLKTDKSAAPVFYSLNITAFDDLDMIDPGAGGEAMKNDFKLHLQAIASGKNFNSHYYYLVKKYLCNGEKTSAQASDETGSKKTDFYSYCIGLTFSKNIVIDEVGLTMSPKKCVSMVNVQQHRTEK